MRTEPAVLFGDPSLDIALEGAVPVHTVIYPLFMSDGYYVRQALPAVLDREPGRCLGKSQWRILRPLGLDLGLPGLISSAAKALLLNAGWQAEDSTLLLIGHGSAISDRPRQAIAKLVDRLRLSERFAAIRAAYVEESPTLDEIEACLPDKTVVIGLFTGSGQHSSVDVALRIEQGGRQWPTLASIGDLGGLADLISESVCGELAGGWNMADDPVIAPPNACRDHFAGETRVG